MAAPQLSPIIAEVIIAILKWIYWGLLAIMIASLVIGVIKTTAGDIENAKKWFVRGMIGAVISSALTMVVLVLIGK
ncbi:MAG: hypothetical protein RQ885_14465 [Desulfurococcales archaeon]|nr:hypothetical protein [Desulfurococcales archaeon]